jgi:hypothetical protein
MSPALDNDVIVRGSFRVNGSPPSLSEFYIKHRTTFSDLCTEIGRNALVGTFGDFAENIFNSPRAFGEFNLRTQTLSQCFADLDDSDITSGRYLSEAEYESFTRDVLAGGFHLVEMDTRDLDIAAADRISLIKKLSQLALDESQPGRVHRFSANLSGPFSIIEPALSAIWVFMSVPARTRGW